MCADDHRPARLGALVGATVVGGDLDTWAAAYRQYLGYDGDPPELVGEVRATGWQCPEAALCRMVTLRPKSPGAPFLRFVESAAAAPPPLATLGWSAAEIVVADLDAVAALLTGGPFRVLAPPAPLDFEFTDKIRAMQVEGPAGEVLYFTEIEGEIPGFALPRALTLVDRVFVAVLATLAIDRSAAWYAAAAGSEASPTMAARISALSDVHNLDPDTKHALRTVALPGASLIEIDEFPATTTARARAACGLPAGIAMITFDGDRDALLQGPDGELVELVA